MSDILQVLKNTKKRFRSLVVSFPITNHKLCFQSVIPKVEQSQSDPGFGRWGGGDIFSEILPI